MNNNVLGKDQSLSRDYDEAIVAFQTKCGENGGHVSVEYHDESGTHGYFCEHCGKFMTGADE